jgi:programmed cell death protein 5
MNEDEAKKYQEQMLQKQQLELIKKAALFKYLSKEARERLNNIKIVRPELAEKVEMAVMQAIQLGQLGGQITDEQLKRILTEVMESKKFRILKK